MVLISIEGDVGSGKTLLMTYLAYVDTRMVYANYHLNFPRYREMTPEGLLRIPKQSVALFDEAYAWLESRLSGRDSNRFFSYVLFQSRKRGLDMYMTNQLISTVDVRFRSMINVEVLCEATERGFEYVFRRISRRRFNRPRTFLMPFELAEMVYPLYDTEERISTLDERELLLSVSRDKSDIMQDVDEHADNIIKLYPITAIRKGFVSDYCMRNDVPKSRVNLIYDAIMTKKYRL